MSPEDKTRIMDKIRKCLALAKSTEPHEAAAAMRQAQKLMAAANIDEGQLIAAEIVGASVSASVKRRPPVWEWMLVNSVNKAFGVRSVLSTSAYSPKGLWMFYGTSASAELASYAFTVVARQARRARFEFLRIPPTVSRKRSLQLADRFIEGWCCGVDAAINAVAIPDSTEKAMEAYEAINFPGLKTSSHDEAKLRAKRLGQAERAALSMGYHKAKDVRLDRPIEAGEPVRSLTDERD